MSGTPPLVEASARGVVRPAKLTNNATLMLLSSGAWSGRDGLSSSCQLVAHRCTCFSVVPCAESPQEGVTSAHDASALGFGFVVAALCVIHIPGQMGSAVETGARPEKTRCFTHHEFRPLDRSIMKVKVQLGKCHFEVTWGRLKTFASL